MIMMIKKLLISCFVISVAVLTSTACRTTIGDTQHHIETESYKLSISGRWLTNGSQSYDFPADFFYRTHDDTMHLIDNVRGVASDIEYLSDGFGMPPTRYLPMGSYELTLELIHKPGSDHSANFKAVLGNLRDWGYITIDTILWKNIAIVSKGATFVDSLNTHHVMIEPYCLSMSEELYNDTCSFGAWLLRWDNSSRRTRKELFKELDRIGYDTIQQADHIVIETNVRPPYRNRLFVK